MAIGKGMTMLSKNSIAAALGLAFALCAGAAHAQAPATADENSSRLHAAWEDVLESEGKLLDERQFAKLTQLAYQAAAVRVCDAHKLDNAAVAATLNDVLSVSDKNLSAEQVEERKAAILISFGARYGLFIAEAHTDKTVFCEDAGKFKDKPEGAPVYLK